MRIEELGSAEDLAREAREELSLAEAIYNESPDSAVHHEADGYTLSETLLHRQAVLAAATFHANRAAALSALASVASGDYSLARKMDLREIACGRDVGGR